MQWIFVFFMLFSLVSQAGELKEFESDGCTMFMDGPPGKPDLWKHCCFEHDLRYWFGGSKDQMKFTDKELKACVKDVAGSFWANLIYNGVVSGHASPIKNKYHWSWAWEPERKDAPLTGEEIVYIETELYKIGLDPQYVDHFIKKYLKP